MDEWLKIAKKDRPNSVKVKNKQSPFKINLKRVFNSPNSSNLVSPKNKENNDSDIGEDILTEKEINILFNDKNPSVLNSPNKLKKENHDVEFKNFKITPKPNSETTTIVDHPDLNKKIYPQVSIGGISKSDFIDAYKELLGQSHVTKNIYDEQRSIVADTLTKDSCKALEESFKEVESGLTKMGQVIRLLGFDSINDDVKSNTENEEKDEESSGSTECTKVSDINQKEDVTPLSDLNVQPDLIEIPTETEHIFTSAFGNKLIVTDSVVSLTPPISEIENDDTSINSSKCNKRGRSSQSSSKLNEPLEKKSRKSLIDEYFTVNVDEPTEPGVETSTTEEYEVDEIKQFSKVKGKFCFHVSWKGYSSDEDTFEPVDNLTGCDDVLLKFFKARFNLRLKEKSPEQFFKLLLPTENCVKPLLVKAFLSLPVLPSLKNIDNAVAKLHQSKSIKLKTKEEINEDIYKLASMRDPHGDRYKSFHHSIAEQPTLKEANKMKEKVSAELRGWERSINKICSDPVPVAIENTVDLCKPPSDFVYINDYLPGDGILIPTDPMVGCECDECSHSQKKCCAHQMSSHYAYNKYGKLRVSLGTAIYECNKLCKCPPDCNNRVVQRGRTVKLCIFRTANRRGWGVKALEFIRKDSFVVEYVGEVISSEEAESRGQVYDAKGCTYLFDLDYNKGDQNPYTVDAAKYGNVSHFINHSCDPNLVVFNVWTDCLDPDLPKIALFAARDIKKGEELSFDYNSSSTRPARSTTGLDELLSDGEGDMFQTPPNKQREGLGFSPNSVISSKSKAVKNGKTECRCGAANCRGFFF